MNEEKEQQYDVILSFTSWKGRIYDRKFLYVLQHALEQTTTYKYKVVLALSDEEFPKKEDELPKDIVFIAESMPDRFEIIWTHKNTKALKKLNPAMHKWPELPIITFDDDEILSKNAVERMMCEHKKTPECIIGADCHSLKRQNCTYDKIKLVTHVRLFPAHSLEDLSEEIFSSVFNNLEDDIFNGIRSAIKGTKSRRIGINGLTVDGQWFPVLYDNKTNLGREYRRADALAMVREFVAKYPQYKKQCI